jgi:integrase
MSKPLTDAACRKYAPGPERRRIRDPGAQSLFLIIEPSGRKSFAMRFRRPDGKPGKLTLGPLAAAGCELEGAPQIGMPLTLAAARQLAAEVHRQRALGHDPIADAKARKHRQRAELDDRANGAFAVLARKFIDEHARKNRRWREVAGLLGFAYPPDGGDPALTPNGLAARWADRPVREIDGHDIWSVVDEARRVGVPGRPVRNAGLSEPRGRALLAALSSLFGWLQRHRRVESNPCMGVFRPPSQAPRERVLTADEVARFWAACDRVGEPFGAIFRVLLLTAQRLNEVAGMRRSELRDDGTWLLPGARTKNGRAHVVPLSPSALEIIAGMPSRGDLVFTTTGSTPPSGWSRVKRRLDAAMKPGAPWRLHDLRRTAITNMAELGIRPDVIERVVNHVSGTRAGVAGVYNRSELLPERRAALERWAVHVSGLVSPQPDSKVVDLPRKRGR